MRRLLTKRNFDPDQQRVPSGRTDGGQWMQAAGSRLKDKCIDECYRLLERPEPQGTSLVNTWAFHRCVNDCLSASG